MPLLVSRQEAILNKLITYYTGVPCLRGHLSVRFTKTSNCKQCQQDYAKKHQTRYHLKRHFNITEAEYNHMLDQQHGVCKICKEEETIIDGQSKKVKPLSVDHCHDTGKIRGLLCTKCNLGISYFKHEPCILIAAANYCET